MKSVLQIFTFLFLFPCQLESAEDFLKQLKIKATQDLAIIKKYPISVDGVEPILRFNEWILSIEDVNNIPPSRVSPKLLSELPALEQAIRAVLNPKRKTDLSIKSFPFSTITHFQRSMPSSYTVEYVKLLGPLFSDLDEQEKKVAQLKIPEALTLYQNDREMLGQDEYVDIYNLSESFPSIMSDESQRGHLYLIFQVPRDVVELGPVNKSAEKAALLKRYQLDECIKWLKSDQARILSESIKLTEFDSFLARADADGIKALAISGEFGSLPHAFFSSYSAHAEQRSLQPLLRGVFAQMNAKK